MPFFYSYVLPYLIPYSWLGYLPTDTTNAPSQLCPPSSLKVQINVHGQNGLLGWRRKRLPVQDPSAQSALFCVAPVLPDLCPGCPAAPSSPAPVWGTEKNVSHVSQGMVWAFFFQISYVTSECLNLFHFISRRTTQQLHLRSWRHIVRILIQRHLLEGSRIFGKCKISPQSCCPAKETSQAAAITLISSTDIF